MTPLLKILATDLKVVDESTIVGRQSQEASQLSNIGRGWPVRNSADLVRICAYPIVGNHMAKKLHGTS